VWVWVIVHVVLSPLILAPGSLTTGIIGNALGRVALSVPDEPDLTERTVVIVNSPMDLVTIAVPVMRSSLEKPMPKHAWALATGLDPVEITRINDRTVEVRQEGGFLPSLYAQMFRGPDDPVTVGQRFELSEMTAEVVSITEDGRPLEVRFRFDVPLEDPKLIWMVLEGGKLERCAPPAVGDTIRLPAIDMFWWG